MTRISGVISDYMYENSLLRKRIKELESGEALASMKKHYSQAIAAEIRKNHALEKRIAHLDILLEKMQEKWFQTCDDLYQEMLNAEKNHKKEIDRMQEKIWEVERQRDAALDKAQQRAEELYKIKTELEEEKGKNQELQARIKKDHTNSSKPSSANPNHETIPNGRETTGRKPGGQPGHAHHPRKPQQPDTTHILPDPVAFKDKTRYVPLDDYEKRQVISAAFTTNVVEYVARKYKDKATGKIVYAEFPEGVDNDVNYDGSIKALAYLLNNDCNVSIGKTKEFLREVSDGKIDLSVGMICNLVNEFSKKTESERNDIFLELLSQPVLHADYTFQRVEGKLGTVLIVCAPDGTVLFQAKEKKGDEGIKGSPLEMYNGTVVSDHEAAFVKCGDRHQECMSHVKRYAIGSTQNEPKLQWNKDMTKWVSNSIHFHNQVNNGAPYDTATAGTLLKEYDDIMAEAQEEYDYEPPTKYYMDGYNLFKRLRDYKEDYTLFLRDPSIPPTNNAAERHARAVKRKSHQMMVRRSRKYDEAFLDGLTITRTLKGKGEKLYKKLTEYFNR